MMGLDYMFSKENYNKTGIENIIQIELANKFYGDKQREHIKEWIKNNSKYFRDYIENHYNDVKEFKNFLEQGKNPEEIIERIANAIKDKKEMSK